MSNGVRYGGKVRISSKILCELLGFEGGDIRAIETTDYDRCVVLVIEHSSLPQSQPGEMWQEIDLSFRSVSMPVAADWRPR